MNMKSSLAALALLVAAGALHAQEAAIRKNLAERLPTLGKIEEVAKGPIQGLWEVRVGSDIYYTDDQGNYLVQGAIFDTRAKRNLTEEREQKLLAVDFAALPLKDAFTIVRGNGARKMAIFEDPNCSYCKRFERDLQKIDNVTVYMFLYPILGGDSPEKSRNHWCTADKGRAWQDWMVRDKPAPLAMGACDTGAITRNLEFGRKHKIQGTPTTFFADGTRMPGAMPLAQVEKLLAQAGTAAKPQ
ncbi:MULTISPECIES: DsbC family protein [Ramlibacter]|uniref:Thiol:disulfide interchange protein n=1 Tax=Ramlibacter aquaticus TaxID=2780094 RepID=A0ABR9SAU1_9BURK|nr:MULTISPECIES: DsbC family protein [Ramlibacter]MBE7939465.1 DsbC family protein [Ramlibacter aquaticus]